MGRRRLEPWLLMLAQVACKPVALPTPPAEEPVTSAHVTTLQLHLPPGAAVPTTILLGGKAYKPGLDGRVAVNAAVLAAAGRDGLLLLAPGMQPRRIGAGQDGPVELLPAPALGAARVTAGTPLRAGGVGLGFDAAALAAPTDVTVAVFPGSTTPADLERAQATDGQIGRPPCSPAPCAADLVALGMSVTVDGKLGAGRLSVDLDLASWLRGWDGQAPEPWLAAPADWPEAERTKARFAARLLAGVAALTPAGKQALQERYGLTLTGSTATVALALGDGAATQGAVTVEVDGLAALGVALAVTVISSATAAPLPRGAKPLVTPSSGPALSTPEPAGPASPTPPPLVPPPDGGNAPRLLCRGGGALLSANVSVVANNGASIISDHGGGVVPRDLIAGLISDNGGGLVGKVKAPNLGAKWNLLAAFPVVDRPAIRVRLPYVEGQPSVLADATGAYRFDGLPPTGPNLVVVAEDAEVTLLTLAPAPGRRQVTADLNPDTTAVAAEALVRLVQGCSDAPNFYPPGYADAVARVAALPTYDLPAFSRLESQLYAPPPGPRPGTYSFGAPWADQLGCTFVTRRDVMDSTDSSWHTVASGLAAGNRVGFDCDLNTTFNGVNWVDYTGDPAFGGNGRLIVQMPGYSGLFPRGLILTLPAAGDVQVRYQDYAGGGLGNYANNIGSIATRFDVDACR